jgi:hypothetical protein
MHFLLWFQVILQCSHASAPEWDWPLAVFNRGKTFRTKKRMQENFNPNSAVGSLEKGNLESFRRGVEALVLPSSAVSSRFNNSKVQGGWGR